MEELQLALTAARVDQRNFGLWINNWQVGQTLNALVTNQLPTGELVLRVAGQQITATADIPVQAGKHLLLEVKQLQPVPTLRVLNPAAGAAAPGVSGTLQLLPAVGNNLASQPLALVAQAIQGAVLGAAGPVVAAPLEQILRQVSTPQQLSHTEGLTAAIKGSGTFFESSLQQAGGERQPMLASDLKAGLFRALASVEGALGRVEALALNAADIETLLELKRELEAGLGRITVHQLNSQPGDTAMRQWQLEIPVQIAQEFHSVRVFIEQDGSGGSADAEDEDNRWRVSLQLAPPALGNLELMLSLQGDTLELRTAAAQPAVRALIDQSLDELVRALASRGIQLHTTATADIATPSSTVAADSSSPALDVRA